MTANVNPIYPLTPVTLIANLVAATASVSRAPTATASMGGTPAYGVALGSAAPAAGRRIDKITVKAAGGTNLTGATTAATVIIWYDDGTTGYPYAEILVPVVTPSASVASLEASMSFTNLVLPSGHKLWASTTIVGAAAAHALIVTAHGGDYQ